MWTPQNASAKNPLPVRFWVYGGSNVGGGTSDPLFDGCNVAAHDAVVVTVNYRLGPLGFLAVKDASIQGNQALQDIILGLEWVQQNIYAFGGDKVWLMG